MRTSAINLEIGKLALACLCVLSACSAPLGQSPDAEDETHPALPTFVSLNPCLDAILTEVAEPEQILALSHYSRDPAASSLDADVAARYSITGGTAEEVLALQPDIVLASTFIDPATRSALERSGLTIETFDSPVSVEQSIDQIERLADLAGDQARADQLIASISAEPNLGSEISALLWQPGEIVAGEASLVHDHLVWAGFSSHSSEMGLGQADRVSLEQILANPPQVLLVAGESAGQLNPLLDNLRTTLTAEFPPQLFYCGGTSIPKARARLMEIREEFERTRYMAPQ